MDTLSGGPATGAGGLTATATSPTYIAARVTSADLHRRPGHLPPSPGLHRRPGHLRRFGQRLQRLGPGTDRPGGTGLGHL